MREKAATWILLGTLLTMAVVALPGCGFTGKSQQEIDRQRDLPDLQKSKQGGVDPDAPPGTVSGGNKKQ